MKKSPGWRSRSRSARSDPRVTVSTTPAEETRIPRTFRRGEALAQPGRREQGDEHGPHRAEDRRVDGERAMEAVVPERRVGHEARERQRQEDAEVARAHARPRLVREADVPEQDDGREDGPERREGDRADDGERDLGGDEVARPDQADQEEEPVGLALAKLAFRSGHAATLPEAPAGSRWCRLGPIPKRGGPAVQPRGLRGGVRTAPTSSSSSPSSSPPTVTSFPSSARVAARGASLAGC